MTSDDVNGQVLNQARNAAGRTFCKLKDDRRIATGLRLVEQRLNHVYREMRDFGAGAWRDRSTQKLKAAYQVADAAVSSLQK